MTTNKSRYNLYYLQTLCLAETQIMNFTENIVLLLVKIMKEPFVQIDSLLTPHNKHIFTENTFTWS